ncbi:FAD-binding domain-containing protein [Serendipita vermifera]|nr:FAD-binding domain-containing protein [Serendipita vermifera]
MRWSTLSTSLVLAATASWAQAGTCTYPQPCWPAQKEWDRFNATIRGGLVRARPPAYPCHQPNYNEAQCAIVKQNWNSEIWRAQQPGAYYTLASETGDSYCNIDNNSTVPCNQGLVPYYAAQVKSVQDVQAAVCFAKKNKLSTRVKGASHDFQGRSSGNGTFAIHTINLKGIEFQDNFKPNGAPSNSAPLSVVHVGAGEHWWHVYKAADEHGRVVVGGAQVTVGAAGGWILGGGHSPLSREFGIGADNAVEFEIVTPDGELRKANAYRNKDLFWALRGGGPGFGVTTKVTYKTHPALSSIVAISVNLTFTQPSYRGLLRTFLALQPATEAQNFSSYCYPTLPSTDPTKNLFQALFLVPNSSNYEKANSTIKPLYDFIESEKQAGREIGGGIGGGVLPSFLSVWGTLESQDGHAGIYQIMGSRLLPISLFAENKVDSLLDVLANTPLTPFINLVSGGKVHEASPDSAAAHPSWRTATHELLLIGGWATDTPFPTRQAIRQTVTQETQKLAALVPGGGSYFNEGDINEPNRAQTFWGSHYNRLLSIKRATDPLGIFTCYHCIGDTS